MLNMRDNWYILFTLVVKQEKLCQAVRSQGLNAFLPMMEYYRRDIRSVAVKPMFPGYVFVRTDHSQEEFDAILLDLSMRKQGIIRELKDEGVTALRQEEKDFFSVLLDAEGCSRMSYGYLKGGRAVVTAGPLMHFQDRIVRTDRHNRLAWLDFEFMNRRIQAGLNIKNELMPVAVPDEINTLADGTIVDIAELKGKMMGL